jgi:hypothetical protein
MPRPPFPPTPAAFQSWFSTEEACVRYMAESRWPEGYACPRCSHRAAYELTTRRIPSAGTAIAKSRSQPGTVLHGTRLALQDWFSAAYLVATHTPGVSAVQLQRQLGLKRYVTTWALLQKLRRAMVRPERDRLAGKVEVDETYVGGLEVGRRGGRLRDSTKTIIVGAVEIRRGGSGRVRLAVAEDLSATSLVGFVKQSVAGGCVVHTPTPGPAIVGSRTRAMFPGARRRVTQRTRSASSPAFTACHPTSRRGWQEPTTAWGRSTCHSTSTKHVFGFNRRKAPVAALQSLVGLTSQHAPTTYRVLYDGEPTG